MVSRFIVIAVAQSVLGAKNQVNHSVADGVENLCVKISVSDRLTDSFVVESVGLRHFQIVAGGKTDDSVIDGTPVADNNALKAPFVTEDFILKSVVIRAVYAVDAVV